VKEYVRLAQIAEHAGFDQFWVSNDLFLRSCTVILTAVTAATKRIEIGTCILNPYTINPAEIAMFAATLDEYSDARFNLGLASGAGDFLAWVGVDAPKPRTAVVESIDAINRLTSNQRAEVDGDFLHWTNEAYLRFESRRRVPVYLGAMSPKMLVEIGRSADGGLPLLFPPEHFANVLPLVQQGANEVNRSLNSVDLAACIWVSLDEDRQAAQEVLKEKIAYYGHALSPTILAQLGLTHNDFVEIEHAAMVENDMTKARSLVTPQMLKIGIAGSVNDLIERLEGLVAMGARHISFGPPLGPDPEAAVALLGEKVLPHFRLK
jgi:5,10-methylenetetrahydromethanopterin reductase